MHTISLLFILGLVELISVQCRTLFVNLNAPTSEELAFMKKYGYLEVPEEGDLDFTYTAQSISEAVTKMQAFASLPQTGVLDAPTRELFTKKRCGVRDIEDKSTRSRRFVISQGWPKKDITYRVLNGSSTLDKCRIEELMEQALSIWAPHGGLNFYRMEDGRADIRLVFVTGAHGDGFPFDGPGHVVAHAFPPPHGAMHFDDDEVWGDSPSDDDDEVTDFFAVVVHEIGHALGMSHSDVKSSVMYPYYQVPVERLHHDDIQGMRKLYYPTETQAEDIGSSAERTESSVMAPRFTKADEDDIPDLCYTNYDTIQVIQGKIFVFEEEWVWVLSERKQVLPGFPRRFHELFRGLPRAVTHITTIYEKLNGNIAIFQEKKYWEFNATFHLIKRGKLTDYSIPRHVPELSSVFVSNYNNKTYLIEYERFWRFDETSRKMDRGYPKEMSAWRDLPYPVDSALVWKGDTYFFRGPRFWRFDNARIQTHPYYPLPTAQIWFPCEPSPDMDRYLTNDEP